jgi:hypothetical protein
VVALDGLPVHPNRTGLSGLLNLVARNAVQKIKQELVYPKWTLTGLRRKTKVLKQLLLLFAICCSFIGCSLRVGGFYLMTCMG